MKKILISLLAGAVMTTAFALSAMAAGDTTEGADNAVAKIGDQYYTTVDKAMADAVDIADETVIIEVLKDINNIPAPTRAGLYFKAADGVKVTYRVNPPRFDKIDGTVTYEGFDFTTYDSGNGLFAAFDGGHQLEDLEVVFKNCIFGGEKSIGIWGWATATAAESITLDGCKIVDGSKLYFTFGKVNNIVLKNCDFSNYSAGGAIVQMPEYAGNITVTDCDFGNGFINFAPNQGDFERSIVIEESVFNGEKAVNLHSNFTNSSIDFDEVTFVENTLGGITSAFMVAEGVDFQNVFEDADVTFEDNATADGAEVEDFIVPANAVAKIGNTFYATLQEAFNAATTDGNVIDLMGNTIMVKDEMFDPINGRRCYDVKAKPVIVKNGTIDLTAANVSDSVFRLENADDAITFENVNFVQNEDAANSMTYFINIHTSGNVVKFINCEFDIAKVSSVIANTSGGTVLVKDCEATVASGNFLYRGNATVENVTFISETGRFLHANAYPTTIKNSTIVTSEIVFIAPEGTLAITENSSVKANAVRHYYDSTNAAYKENVITIDSTSSLEAETLDLDLVDTENSAGTIVSKADSIAVEFVKADVDAQGEDNDEDADLYNINLVGANDEIISRLNSADLTFVIENTTGKTAYEIIASNEEVAIAPVNNSDNRYEFHYDGKDGVKTDVANVITIGQVKFTGYGIYTFSVDADADTNVAHATTISDNIVDTFVPNDDDTTVANGELVIENYIKAEILVPTRELVINIDFPNAIKDNEAAYQDMTVTVSGADLETDLVVELGVNGAITDLDEYITKTSEDKAVTAVFADGAYKVTITDLLNVDTTYTVVVEGAGYRTARYTVTMTEDKTLNFWNNVKDNAIEVEEDKESSKKNVTFLAGDIVKDDTINIYDLSAVVSYFGEVNLSATNNKDYVKYDLNRDGKIDSKDVAYVLVSWGK